MFEAPTIAGLAEDVVRMGRGPDETVFAGILREVEALTEEEATQQLDGNCAEGNRGRAWLDARPSGDLQKRAGYAGR